MPGATVGAFRNIILMLTTGALIRVFNEKNVDKPSNADKYEYFHDFKLD